MITFACEKKSPTLTSPEALDVIADFARTLLGSLAAEHRCAVPDNVTAWQPVTCLLHADVDYICPECGQHFVRLRRSKALALIGERARAA